MDEVNSLVFNKHQFIPRYTRSISGFNSFTISHKLYSEMKLNFFKNIAMHMFKWTNLPPGLESEELERMLIHRGTVCFFNTVSGFYILPYTNEGQFDVYNKPILARAQPMNSTEMASMQIDSVPRILWDNATHTRFIDYLLEFADRLAEIQTSIEIAERQARIPSILKVNEDNKESYERLQSKIDEGYPVLIVNESMITENAIQVLPTAFNPSVLTSLWDTHNKVEGEAYALLGTMYNIEQNKAAGVGAAETIINYAQTFAMANSRLEQRQRWCEKLNAEFNIGIWCEKSNDYDEVISAMMQSNSTNKSDIANEAEKDKTNNNETVPKEGDTA